MKNQNNKNSMLTEKHMDRTVPRLACTYCKCKQYAGTQKSNEKSVEKISE